MLKSESEIESKRKSGGLIIIWKENNVEKVKVNLKVKEMRWVDHYLERKNNVEKLKVKLKVKVKEVVQSLSGEEKKQC